MSGPRRSPNDPPRIQEERLYSGTYKEQPQLAIERSSMRWTPCAIQAAGPEKRKPLGPQTLSFAIGPGRFGRASVRAICAAAGSCASTPSTMIAAVNLVDREASPAPSNKD